MGYGREMAEDAEIQNFIYGYKGSYTELMSQSRCRQETQEVTIKETRIKEARVKERDAKCEQIMSQCLKCSMKESPNKEFPGCPEFKLDAAWEMCSNFLSIIS